MYGVHCLGENVVMDKKTCMYKSKSCPRCGHYAVEDVVHALFECSTVVESLDLFWESIRNTAPSMLHNEMRAMNPRCLTIFILYGFNCKYTPEWADIYNVTSSFISDTYVIKQTFSMPM